MTLSHGGSWSTPARPNLREVNHPQTRKIRWWTTLKQQREIEL